MWTKGRQTRGGGFDGMWTSTFIAVLPALVIWDICVQYLNVIVLVRCQLDLLQTKTRDDFP